MSLKATYSTGLVDQFGEPCDGPPPGVLDSFLRWAENAPHRPALETADETVDYGQLTRRSVAVAARLRDAGVRAGDTVGVLLPNGADAVTAVLAILRLGAAYLPVSPKDPDRQVARILPDAGVRVVCTDGRWSRLTDAGFTLIDVATVRVDGDDWVEPHPAQPDDVAYLCYTSGSTGDRKGVVVEHGNLAHSTAARRATYPGAGRFYWMSPLNFDSSAAGLWGTLTSGGTLIIADDATLTDRAAILRSLATTRATALLCIPALYDALLHDAVRLPEPVLPFLRTVILAGEALPQRVADRHFRTFGTKVDLVNEYGPTECTVWASYHRLRPSETVTIGVPAPGVTVDIVSDDLVEVPAGHWGQIMISGPTVARGYRTRLAGHSSPFVRNAAGARAYLTGDVGRISAAGRIEFGGRVDDQVKVRGHRIAMGAVEQALLALDAVRRTAVVQDGTTGELHAFVEADRRVESADALKGRLAESVPRYMVPATVDLVDLLPVTSTGKVDRAALRRSPPVAPATSTARGTREAVASAWSSVLGTGDVPDDTSFFDAGGNSLLVFKLQDALAERLPRRPDVVELFAHPTIRSQVRLFDRADAAAPDPAAARLAAARRQRMSRSAAAGASSEPHPWT